MAQRVETLCGDPLFQLNLAIWLSQSKPDFAAKPIFYESGFSIYSIGPRLVIPPDIRLKINESKTEYQDSAVPDMVLTNDDRTKVCILECKKSSFGVKSSTALQAKTLLVISGPTAAEVLAIGLRNHSQGVLTYLTRNDQTDALQDTLDNLISELLSVKIEVGESGCFGIGCNESSITIEYPENLKEIMNLTLESPVEVLLIEEGIDPRPLYFIPYDPSAFNQQSEDEQKICRRILYERFLSHILCKVGSAEIPAELIFSIDEILSAVTFQLYTIWDDSPAKKHLRRLLKDFMMTVQVFLHDGLKKDVLTFKSGLGWVIEIKDHEFHEDIIKQMSKFKPGGMDLEKVIMSSLFDD
jgi:hypothetical protein